MQILFHLGAHCTDDGLLIRSILRNRARLAEEGIVVPGPGRYRELIGDVSTKLRGAPASAETETLLIETIRDDESADRIVLSSENFLCRDKVALGPDGLYPKADKAAWLRACFPSHEVGFALAVRNPATFIPDLVARHAETPEARGAALAGVALEQLLWSDVVARIAGAVPGAPITVWCHEDTPFLWSEIMRDLTQHDPFTALDGALDMAERIITPDGLSRLSEFLSTRADLTENRRRTAIAAFLEAHAVSEAVETVIDIPGWTEETVADLTELYEMDVARIRTIPGVTFLEA
ncbi:hypothetical protein GQ651_02840 [Alphaproteobacteria bacterium GH1-50]|uniref:Uncharacterized protein n=1 Tax=Kangsaoukella pontilimi TaxID=2691042 RepID=A0A7C9ME32_9RHOB|nr:hypothetical protein [Kangsaoukella pontilimi]MXQ06776.1 hypothetical protein [Kangsaoukella pontilimi]